MLSLVGRQVTLHEVQPHEAQRLRSIVDQPEVARWWMKMPPPWPLHPDPGSTRLSILFENEVVGLIHFSENTSEEFRSASIDIFVDSKFHRRGIATDAIRTVVEYLVKARGHHRLTIDPVVDNAPAIVCYEKVGFHRVGVMHGYWRDRKGELRDGLLMELCPKTLR